MIIPAHSWRQTHSRQRRFCSNHIFVFSYDDDNTIHHLSISPEWTRMNEWMFVSTPGSRKGSYASIRCYYTTLCPQQRANVNRFSLSHLLQSLPLRFRPWRWNGVCFPSTLRHIWPLWASVSSCVRWRALNRDLQRMIVDLFCVSCADVSIRFASFLMWFWIPLGKVCLLKFN